MKPHEHRFVNEFPNSYIIIEHMSVEKEFNWHFLILLFIFALKCVLWNFKNKDLSIPIWVHLFLTAKHHVYYILVHFENSNHSHFFDNEVMKIVTTSKFLFRQIGTEKILQKNVCSRLIVYCREKEGVLALLMICFLRVFL